MYIYIPQFSPNSTLKIPENVLVVKIIFSFEENSDFSLNK